MSDIVKLETKTFIDYLKEQTDKELDKYLFKVERVGHYFTTQDCKPFCSYDYRQIAYLYEFVQWIKAQPLALAKLGTCEEITEIWYKKTFKKIVDRQNKQPEYVLIWTKEKGWLGKQHFIDII